MWKEVRKGLAIDYGIISKCVGPCETLTIQQKQSLQEQISVISTAKEEMIRVNKITHSNWMKWNTIEKQNKKILK